MKTKTRTVPLIATLAVVAGIDGGSIDIPNVRYSQRAIQHRSIRLSLGTLEASIPIVDDGCSICFNGGGYLSLTEPDQRVVD